ncbi:Glutamate decarboxylase 1 [Acipenser ruthenus]|uniref:Glutamate decarboxylase 1 n=1 Tax=Acipenser ruthenus TaxID=7906 RepID=A0A662YQ55_ACIRT|nr:Glutamate decarboxylase 1 [Acipenser ruthenus]
MYKGFRSLANNNKLMHKGENPLHGHETLKIVKNGSAETLKTKGKRKADPLWLKTQQLIIPSENESQERQSGTESRTTNFSTIYGRDLLPAKNGEENTKQFLIEVVHILLNYVSKSFDRNTKVLDFHYPHQLKDGLDGFSLELSDNPENLEQLLVDCRDTLKYGVKTGHPRFFNQLSTGLDVIGLAGEWLTATANTNIFTFEISPVFIMMEEILLKKMYEKIGWPSEEGDGIFSPGGSISNLYSVLVARYYRFPEAKTKGMACVPRLVLFTSEHSHYSIKKAAAVLGIGTENVILVKCNERGKMIPSELELKIMETEMKGFVPFYVNATAGTTVYGAIDPLSEIADICEKYKLWMHVDGLLQLCNQLCADYLFQPDKHYDVSYDTGDKAIQCGRHVDVFKFWLMWKAKGAEGFEVQVNKCLDNAEYLYNKLKQRVDFKLVFDGKPEHSNVCFWYIPPSLRELPNGQERSKRLHEVAPRIKAKMMEEGTTMIGYQPQGENVNFFRCVFSNPATSKADVDFLIEEIVRLGNDL